MNKNAIYITVLLFSQIILILIAYEFLFNYTKINHFSFASSSLDLIPIYVWGLLIAEICLVFFFLRQKN